MEKLNKIPEYNFERDCCYMNTDDDNYQLEFLYSFNIQDGVFNLEYINNTVEKLFNAVKDDVKMIELLELIKKKYNTIDNEMAFMMCFSYDFFERTHTILREYVRGNEPSLLIQNIIDDLRE